MKINWYMVSSAILLVGISIAIGWIWHKPIEPQMTTVPVSVRVDSVKVEHVITRHDTVTVYVNNTPQEAMSYKADTIVPVQVTVQYPDADSLTTTQQFPTRMRLSAEFFSDPLNFYNYISGEVYPITVPMRIKERLKEVPANTYSFWMMPMAGLNDSFNAGAIVGFRQFGIGGIFGKRQPTWIAGYQLRP
jgi:hypothetical protein